MERAAGQMEGNDGTEVDRQDTENMSEESVRGWRRDDGIRRGGRPFFLMMVV